MEWFNDSEKGMKLIKPQWVKVTVLYVHSISSLFPNKISNLRLLQYHRGVCYDMVE